MPDPWEREIEEIVANVEFPKTPAFESEAQEICYRKVAGYGRELFGEMFEASEKNPTFFLHFGSAHIGVRVSPLNDDDSLIDVSSWVITEVEMTESLVEYLLRENHTMHFGAFRLDEDNDILFSHRIIGSTCGKNELKATIRAIAVTADEYDEKIKTTWGGKRWFDPR